MVDLTVNLAGLEMDNPVVRLRVLSDLARNLRIFMISTF